MNKFTKVLRLFAAIAAATGIATAAQASWVPKTLALADFNGNGDDEAVAVVDNMGNGMGVVVDTGTLGLTGASFLFTGPGAVIDAAVVAGQGTVIGGRDGVAFLLQQDRPVIEAYDPRSGGIYRRVRLPAGHEGVSLDTADWLGPQMNPTTVACVLTEWTTATAKIRPRLFNIDMLTKNVISKPALSADFTGLNAVIDPMRQYCLVLLWRNSDGKGSVQVWDIATGVKMNSIPIPNGQDPIDHASARFTGTGVLPTVATLVLRQSDGRGRVIANEIETSTTSWAYALPAGQVPVRIIGYVPDAFVARIAVLANRTSDNTPVVTILNSNEGTLDNTIEYTSGNVGNDVSFHETYGEFQSSDFLAVTTDTGVVEIRDTITGELIGSLGGG